MRELIAYGGIAVIILVFYYFIGAYSCAEKSIGFSAYRFGLFSGCLVVHKGRWLPLENIRGFD